MYSTQWCIDGPCVWEDHYKNGVLHREDGPAVVKEDGSEYWYLDGCLHRLTGPAVFLANGDKLYYINGYKLCKEDFYNNR